MMKMIGAEEGDKDRKFQEIFNDLNNFFLI